MISQSRMAWLGFAADGTPVDGIDGAIAAHRAAADAVRAEDPELAAAHEQNAARIDAGRVDTTKVVSHKAANLAAHSFGGTLLPTRVTTLKVQS